MNIARGRHRVGGFTLIELMVTLTIVAILAAIAYPAYQQFVRGARQSDAQRFMLDVSSHAQQYRMDMRRYPQDFCNGNDDLALDVPTEVADYYDMCLTADNTATPPEYTITATPKTGSMQEGEATLTLTSTGKKTPAEEWK